MDIIADIVDGKNVIVVGRAHSLLLDPIAGAYDNQGEFIDSFDVVMRINYMAPFFMTTGGLLPKGEAFIPQVLHRHLGRRTTISYTNLDGLNLMFSQGYQFERFRESGGEAVILEPLIQAMHMSNPRHEKHLREHYINHEPITPIVHAPIETRDEWRAAMNSCPYTGTLAVADLLKLNPKSVTLFGFTCYTTDADKRLHDPVGAGTAHRPQHDFNWLQQTALKDDRLNISDMYQRVS
jgi:hypothetical protein